MTKVGLDEVGRGCVFGQVTAGAVIMPATFPDELHHGIKDSKKLSAKQRVKMDAYIKQHAIAYAIGTASAAEIDTLNIQSATFVAMHRALEQIEQQVQITKILVDGNRFDRYKDYEYECIVGGDATVKSIAAASIIAKVYRDNAIDEMVTADPTLAVYDLINSRGYPTPTHLAAIAKHGIAEQHRRTFGPCKRY
jgi:ribonuclease HII